MQSRLAWKGFRRGSFLRRHFRHGPVWRHGFFFCQSSPAVSSGSVGTSPLHLFSFPDRPTSCFFLLILLCMAAVAWTEHSAPLCSARSIPNIPPRTPISRTSPARTNCIVPLTLVQCAQNKKQPCKKCSFRCTPDEPFFPFCRMAISRPLRKTAETDCRRGQRSSGFLRQALFDHQPAEPRQAHGCCRTAQPKTTSSPIAGKFLCIRHKKRASLHLLYAGDAFKARIRKIITSWGRCPCSASRQS